MTEFVNLIAIDSKDDINKISRTEKRFCKVLKFSSKFNLSDIKSCMSTLKEQAKDFPYLFIFVIHSTNYTELSAEKHKRSQKVKDIFDNVNNFCNARPVILQIIAAYEEENTFFIRPSSDKEDFIDPIKTSSKHYSDFKNLSDYLICFSKNKIQHYEEKVLNNFLNFTNVVLVRFLKAINISEKLFMNILTKCAAKGSLKDFYAILDLPFEDERQFINNNAQNLLSETYDVEELLMPSINSLISNSPKTSIFMIAVENSNQAVIDCLMTNCTHLLQQLPFEHRVDISTLVFNKKKFSLLTNLIKSCDFPFPTNLNETLKLDKDLQKLVSKRNHFHNEILQDNEKSCLDIVKKYPNHKFLFNVKNETLLETTIKNKKFRQFVQLKSSGFILENKDIIDALSDEEKVELNKLKWTQTEIIVNQADANSKKSSMMLAARSRIHNATKKENLENQFQNVKKYFESLSESYVCSLLLDAASQDEDLNIIFDFGSESVENMDLKSSSRSLGTTYPGLKWIFIGAKANDQLRIQRVKGVVIHEISHYVMKLVFENNENPFYEKDQETAKKFQSIVKETKEIVEKLNVDVTNSDEMIIPSVFHYYNEKNHPQELIVRPVQIYAQCSEETTNKFRRTYKSLFEFHDNMLENEVRNFSFKSRQLVKEINKSAKIFDKLEKEQIEFNDYENFGELSQFTIITTNIIKLLQIKFFKQIQQENLPETKNIFIKIKMLKNNVMIQEALKISGLKLFIDCTSLNLKDIENCVSQMTKNENSKFIFIVPSDENSTNLTQLLSSNNINAKQQNIYFKFQDLTYETQINLMQTKVNFQNNSNIKINTILSMNCLENQLNLNSLDTIDEDVLKILINKSPFIINADKNMENSNKQLEILFQPRKLIKKTTTEGSKVNHQIAQEDLLDHVTNMKTILISDLPGNGKTWMLKNILRMICDKDPSKWVTYVDLREYAKAFKELHSVDEFSKFMIANVLKLKSKIEKFIFANLYKNGKTCIIFDQIEGIAGDYLDRVISLCNSFEFNGGNHLWIGARSNVNAIDKKNIKFDVEYRLNEFTKDDGMKFIVLNLAQNDLIQQNHQNIDKESVLEHSKNEKFQILQQKWSNVILKIHKHFIGFPQLYKNLATRVNDMEPETTNNSYDFFREFLKDLYIKVQMESELNAIHIHQYLAIRNYFPDVEKSIHMKIFSDINCEHVLCCDLAFKNEKTIIFHHDCYREFFAADFIVNNLLKGGDQSSCAIILNVYKEVLKSNKFLVIRALVNDALCDKFKFQKFKEFIEVNRNEFGQNIDNIISKVFKEGLENLSKLFITIFKNENCNQIKENLNNTIHHTMEVSSVPESLQKYFEVIISSLEIDDLKMFIKKSEIFCKIINSKVDLRLMCQLITSLEEKIDSIYLREALREPKNNLFHQLCLHREFNEEEFLTFFGIMHNQFSKRDILKMLQNHDENGKNVLHICIEIKHCALLQFIWNKIKTLVNTNAEFKKFIMEKTNQNDSNIMHLSASCESDNFFETLWTLLLSTFIDRNEIFPLLMDKNNAGNSFVHLLVNQHPSLLQLTISVLNKNFEPNKKKEIFKSKDVFGRNVLQKALFDNRNMKTHQLLWETFEDFYNPNKEFHQILKEFDNAGKSIYNIISQYLISNEQKNIDDLTWNEYEKYLLSNKDGFQIDERASSVKQFGCPQSIVTLNSSGSTENCASTSIETLRKMLHHEDVKDAFIVVLSAVGVFRKGKSYFLNYCLRYLYANYKSINFPDNSLKNKKEWMGEEDEPLEGFSWRSGVARDTLGIMIWNDVFLHTYQDTGKKVAIIVLDTEGLFNSYNNLNNELRISVLSTLMSSIHVFSTLESMQEHFEYLHVATEFAKRMIDDLKKSEKPFQKLVVLVRDWVSLVDHLYGLKSGNNFLKSFDSSKDQASVRDAYEQICCTLLPHPGSKVTGGKKNLMKYNGNWKDMDDEFRPELIKTIEELLKPEKLIVKKVKGIEQKASEYLQFIESFINIENKYFKVESIYETVIQNELTNFTNSLFEDYRKDLNRIHEGKTNKSIVEHHSDIKNEILKKFRSQIKVGNKTHADYFHELLENKIDNYYEKMVIFKNNQNFL